MPACLFACRSGFALAAALAIFGACSLSSDARAASPALGSINPTGGQRGTDVEAVFGGSRLKDAQSLLFYYPGISLKKIEPINDNSFKAILAIAPDCRLGNHAVRVRTASGISELMLFSVGAMPDAKEVEPNNEFVKPQPITINSTVNGIVTSEDVDFYSLAAKKGDRIVAEVEGIRLGRTRFDPYVSIMDKDRFELASSDDAALAWQDGVAALIAPEDGTYVIQVRDSSFGGNGASNYRLHVGNYPRPTGVVPSGGRPGETVEVRWLGDVGGEFTQKLVVPQPGPPNFYPCIFAPDDRIVSVFASSNMGLSPTPNYFRATDLGNAVEAEPNNELAKATNFTAPLAVNGVIGEPGDVDFFRFKAKKGERYEVRVHARSLRSQLDSIVTLLRANGQGLGTNDDSGGPDSLLRIGIPADDEYVVQITDMLKQGGRDYFYRIEVAPIVPDLSLGLPERVQYKDVTTSIPQGNRTAFLVSANRRDFGGDLAIDIKDLPPGVKMETIPMAGNQSVIPVLLTADENAPLAGTLADVVGTTTDPKQPKVTGHLVQTSLLVAGDNQRPVWTHTTERMATAITAKLPFRVEIVEPKVPLVRNGSMELKVRATRDKDFKAPIAIRMLYNPAGVASSGSVSIPEGQLEATIPLTANGGAELGAFKIAVLAEAQVGDGQVLISSQLAKLEVADAYFQLAFKPAAVEQGKDATIIATVTTNVEFPGQAKLELLGLPAEVTAAPAEINKGTEQVSFQLKTTAKSPAGRHKSLMCRAVITLNGEQVPQTLGPAELRIDAPLPPKATAAKPAAPAAAKPAAVAAAKPAAKPLSRLEQLRQEREGGKPAADKPAANQK